MCNSHNDKYDNMCGWPIFPTTAGNPEQNALNSVNMSVDK
jgi:hypothetical protein